MTRVTKILHPCASDLDAARIVHAAKEAHGVKGSAVCLLGVWVAELLCETPDELSTAAEQIANCEDAAGNVAWGDA